MEIENEQFSISFTKVVEESATQMKATKAVRVALRSRVTEATPVSAQMQTLEQIVPGKPPATNNNWKMEEATKQQNPGGSRQQKTRRWGMIASALRQRQEQCAPGSRIPSTPKSIV